MAKERESSMQIRACPCSTEFKIKIKLYFSLNVNLFGATLMAVTSFELAMRLKLEPGSVIQRREGLLLDTHSAARETFSSCIQNHHQDVIERFKSL